MRLYSRLKLEHIFRDILIGCCSATFALIAYQWLHEQLNPLLIYTIIAAVVILLTGIIAYIVTRKSNSEFERLQFALKSAVNGDYSIRIHTAKSQQFQDIYEQFNEFMESTQQKLAVLQTLGEELVMNDLASKEAAVLEERKRLARDLHDSVSQQLFAIHMCASSLPKLKEVNPDQANEVLQQLILMSSKAQTQMRMFIAQLRPMELENKTLQEALDQWFPDYCRQNQLQGRLEWRINQKLSEAKEHQLFLIIQEAMANVVKHARCKSCYLNLFETENQFIVMLEDDGIGFKQDALKRKSYGLSTMKERAQKLSGSTEIISKEGRGTIVKVSIPKLERKEEQANE